MNPRIYERGGYGVDVQLRQTPWHLSRAEKAGFTESGSVYWSSPDKGFASYVMVKASEDARDSNCLLHVDDEDKPHRVQLYSVNGIGEIRWNVSQWAHSEGDKAALEAFQLVPWPTTEEERQRVLASGVQL